ncbi:hypothetical protein GW17_00006393 [Ensete ventricosum]|nr:hypothetical protein GW17_00006393 [Ensete ventricosum]
MPLFPTRRKQEGKPTALPSPAYKEEDPRTVAFTEEEEEEEEEEGAARPRPHRPVQTWTPVSLTEVEEEDLPAQTWRRNDGEAETSFARRPMDTPLRGKASTGSRDGDSDRTTISEDTFKEFCEWQEEVRLGRRRGWVLENELNCTDDGLREILEDVEETYRCVADKDSKLFTIQIRKIPKRAVFDELRVCAEGRRYVLLQLANQLRGRIADRFDAEEHLRQVRIDLDARARRLEWEKSEVRYGLEKELETRSIDYSMKLKMLLVDEQEVKKQARELEERSASLQREISWLQGVVEEQNQVGTASSEMEITNLKAGAEELRTENGKLQKDLSEMQEKLDASEEDRRCIERRFCEKEKENKELQKSVVSLKQERDEQERTIRGLILGFCSSEVENRSTDQLSRLQMEELRKELESCKLEREKLRHENIGLLSRLQDAGNGGDVSWIKLDQELRARVDCLQTEGLSLLRDISQFNGDLLRLLDDGQQKQRRELGDDPGGHLPVDYYTIITQSLSRRYEHFRVNLQTVAKILDEKSLPTAEGSSSMSKQSEDESGIKQLETESQEYTEVLTAAPSVLSEVTERRYHHMRQQVKKSKENIMLIDDEVVASLKKKTEELEEDIVTEEGHIADPKR